jgi:hypothetical protein
MDAEARLRLLPFSCIMSNLGPLSRRAIVRGEIIDSNACA